MKPHSTFWFPVTFCAFSFFQSQIALSSAAPTSHSPNFNDLMNATIFYILNNYKVPSVPEPAAICPPEGCPDADDIKYSIYNLTTESTEIVDFTAIDEVSKTTDCSNRTPTDGLSRVENVFSIEGTTTQFQFCGTLPDPSNFRSIPHNCPHLDTCVAVGLNRTSPNLRISTNATGELYTTGKKLPMVYKVRTLYQNHSNFIDLQGCALSSSQECKYVEYLEKLLVANGQSCDVVNHSQLLAAQDWCFRNDPKTCNYDGTNICGVYDNVSVDIGGVFKIPQ